MFKYKLKILTHKNHIFELKLSQRIKKYKNPIHRIGF